MFVTHRITNALISRPSLIASSLMLALVVWYYTSARRWQHLTVEVPVFVYNQGDRSINTPDTTWVTLAGHRIDLEKIPMDSLAVHLNGDKLADGISQPHITKTNLLLPEPVSLINCTPLEVTVERVA